MGVSFCKCKLPVFLYFPCINKLKTDRFVSSQPQQDKVVSVENNSDNNNNNNVVSVEEKEEPDLVVASVEEKTPENDDEQEEVNCEHEEEKAVVVLKSCLKKEGCIEKRNVKWMDLVGKELVEIQEFEPVELEEEERDIGNTTCLWFFQ